MNNLKTEIQNHRGYRSFYAFASITLLLPSYSNAIASPEGGEVIEGEADIDYGDWTRVVTGEITVIEWLSFQIAAGETVEFIMPSESSRVLNLINSGVPTEIMGTLIGNGQVFLVNPSGVVFGQGAVVNVGSLYAAAGNISTSDFMDGTYRFTDARGVVENRGHLQGDLIALVGGRVANHGTISAPSGTVIMAAGEQVLIGEHLGNIFVSLEKPTDIDQVPVLNTTSIGLTAGDMYSIAAWNTGDIQADTVQVSANGGNVTIDHDIIADQIELRVDEGHRIELSSNLSAQGDGILFDGDLLLTDDVSLVSSGEHSEVQFAGTVSSQAGLEHDLRISAANGYVIFGDRVGGTVFGDFETDPNRGIGGSGRLGALDITARRVDVSSDILVNQELNMYSPVRVTGSSVTFDVGFGSALFADSIYSQRDGFNDIAFEYSGEAWVGTGQARTPFKFRNGIGTTPALSTNPVGGAFANIRFGGDLNSPSRVSAFMFGSDAQAGLELMSGANLDLSRQFYVSARESITMGVGQKMTSFGSLSLQAKGRGSTIVSVGDLNVLGDLLVSSQGRSGGIIRINGRDAAEIDFVGNESDRMLDGLLDNGVELIASGSITLDADELVSGSTDAFTLAANDVLLLNNLGNGSADGLDIDLFPGGVSLDLFSGQLSLTSGLVYAYDLTLPPTSESPDSEADLASTFTDEQVVSLRNDRPLLAGRQVLRELGLNPRDPTVGKLRNELVEGGYRHDESSAADFGVTIDRLTPRSVERLTEAYTKLLGDRVTEEDTVRSKHEVVVEQLTWLFVIQKDRDLESIMDHPMPHEIEAIRILKEVQEVVNAIDLLELSPLEIQRAKQNFVQLILPVDVAEDIGHSFIESFQL